MEEVQILVPLLVSRDLPSGIKCRLQFCTPSAVIYESRAWPVKEEDVMRLERNNARVIR